MKLPPKLLSQARVIAKGERILDVRRKNSRYRDLSTNQPYVVIGIEANDLRILNNSGRPYLYPSRLFILLDRRTPDDWISESGKDGERYAYPPALNKPGFFEDFFDEKSKAVATFWRIVNKQLASANHVA